MCKTLLHHVLFHQEVQQEQVQFRTGDRGARPGESVLDMGQSQEVSRGDSYSGSGHALGAHASFLSVGCFVHTGPACQEPGGPQSVCICEAVLQRHPQVGCIHYNLSAVSRGRKGFLLTESRLRLVADKVPGENSWMERRAQ